MPWPHSNNFKQIFGVLEDAIIKAYTLEITAENDFQREKNVRLSIFNYWLLQVIEPK